ncbi:MAG: hypothetical protein VW082_06685 [Candidatus Nanopelagicales bacterium]|jgi:hypothetical protein
MRLPLSLALGAGLAAGLVAVPGIASADLGLGPVEQVSAPGIASGTPRIAAGADGQAWAAFTAVDSSTGEMTVQVTERRGELNWSAPTVLSRRGADASAPTIAANDHGDACVSWVEESWAHRRLQVSCHTSTGWATATALGPLAARIDKVALSVADSGNAVVAFTATSATLSAELLHVARTTGGRWSTSSAIDVADLEVDSIRDVHVAITGDDVAGVVWRRDASVLSSTAGPTDVWTPAEVEYAGEATAVAAGSVDDRLVAAWAADDAVTFNELGPPSRAPTSATWSADVETLALVPLDSGVVVFAVDAEGYARAMAVDASGAASRLDLGAASAGLVLRRSGSMIDVALLDDSLGIVLTTLVADGFPSLGDMEAVSADRSADVVLSDSQALLVWVDEESPSSVRAAPTVDDRPDLER